jgi:hypothetical protein
VPISDWVNIIEGVAIVYFAYQQNQIFKRQNEIFATQAGQGAMLDKSSRTLQFKRYWPTIVMVAVMLVTGYDIYDRHAGAPYVIPWWSYGLALLLVGVAIGGAASRSGTAQIQKVPLPKLVIHSALYGIGDATDVVLTERLNGLTKEGLVVPVNNNLVDHDPAPNKFKRLKVSYQYDAGDLHSIVLPEHSWLILPENPQLLKLKSEVEVLEKRIESAPRQWRERFINPQWTAVTGNTFVNTTVEMDGKAFRHCRFENVTLVFHGNAPTELTVDNRFSGTTLRIDTDDPAIMMFMQLQMIISKIPGAVVGVKAVDHQGNAMPDNFSITLGPIDQQDSIQEQAEKLSDELREFINKLGPKPVRKPSDKQHTDQEELEAMKEHSAKFFPWAQRLQGGWVGRFADRVEKMRYLLAEQGITDVDLDMALRSSNRDDNNILRIADRLLLLSRTESKPLS